MTTRERDNVVNAGFDNLVAKVIEAAAQGHDIMQESISIALSITDIDTRMRFSLGDLASLIEGKYGKDEMGAFAGACKRSKKTLYSYAAMARTYPPLERGRWLAEPALSWSHLKLAMRLKNAEDAAEFLEHCADEALTVDGAAVELKDILGEVAKAAPLFDGPITIRREGGRIYLQGAEYTALEDGQTYDVRIRGLA